MPVELWFQDEARVGQKGSLSYIWSAVGSRPPMVRDNRHDTAPPAPPVLRSSRLPPIPNA
jgi:hypothetical protein